jgi:hypothetical protein
MTSLTSAVKGYEGEANGFFAQIRQVKESVDGWQIGSRWGGHVDRR